MWSASRTGCSTWPGSRACWPMPREPTSTIWARSWA
nr:MAG TPA: hypothetical protein [Caudoviricetes sp.]